MFFKSITNSVQKEREYITEPSITKSIQKRCVYVTES